MIVKFICVACSYKHDRRMRTKKDGISYTMCPKCGYGGFIKRKE